MIKIDDAKFEIAHKAFLDLMYEKSNGIEFISFNHPIMIEEEIAYKWKVYFNAKKVLQLHKWKTMKKKPGAILNVMKEIFKDNISSNLVEHRYGPNNPDKPLQKVKEEKDIIKLEVELYNFFISDSHTYENFAHRFDRLANYLKDNKLGCLWQFMSYLSFIVDPTLYFPILSETFGKLIKYYGNNVSIKGEVTWERYYSLLTIADLLEGKLMMYGGMSRIAIQSYMYRVGRIVSKNIKPSKRHRLVDSDTELLRRLEKAKRREEIGLKGELLVLEAEKNKLIKLGLNSLAAKVELVSSTLSDKGYDILSFNKKGEKILIEVKSTPVSKENENGFNLSLNEYLKAKNNKNWNLFRVYDIDSYPKIENLKNIVRDDANTWSTAISGYYIKPKIKNT